MCWLSIIIPVFNGEKTLSNTLNSVIVQPLFSFCELIIIDDGSTDHTGELCREYCKQYDNIHVYTQENAGVSSARNRGILLAKGQCLLLLDADDFYVPDSLNQTLIPILEENYDLLLFSDYKSNVDQNRYGVYMRCNDSICTGHKVFPMPELFTAIMYRRELLLVNDIHFEEDIRLNEDQIFVVEALYAATTIRTLNHYLYIYNKNIHSVTSTSSREKYYDMVLAWGKAADWFSVHADRNRQQMLQYVQLKINSRALLYAKAYAQGWHTAKGLRKELEDCGLLERLFALEENQVMPYQIKDLQAFQSDMTFFVLRSKIEGMLQFAGRLALRIPIIRRWRDKKVYPYMSVGVYGPDMH